MFTWISGLFRESAEVRRLRDEVAELKAAGRNLMVAGPEVGTPVFSAGSARQQLEAFKGWVYAAVRPIAQRIAGQEVKVGRRVRRRTGQRVKAVEIEELGSHPLTAALADPNPVMVPWSLMFSTVAALELCGVGYWWLSEADGKLEIWPLPPSWVLPKRGGATFESYEVRPPGQVEPTALSADDVIRFSYPSPGDPFGSVSPLQACAAAVNGDQSIQSAQARAFSQGLWPGMGVRLARNPGVGGQQGNRPELNSYQRAQIISAVKQAYRGVANFGEPIILDGVIEEVFKLTNSPHEMDFLDSSNLTKKRIFQAFGTNPLIAGEIEGTNRAQAVVAERLFLSGTVNPKIELLSQCLTGWMSWRYRDPNLVVWVEPAVADDDETADRRLALAAKFGAVTKDELRAQAGLPPLGPGKGGDELVSAQPAGGNGAAKRSRARRKFVGPGGLRCSCTGTSCTCAAGNGNGKSRLVLPE
jgi:phage portal protein BeeE